MNKRLYWIYCLSAAIYFTQGIEGLPSLPLFFFLKEKLGLTPEKIMYIGSITGVAWLIKPFWGYLCDNYLNKKTWMILSLIGSILISLYFGLLPVMPLFLIVLMLSVGSLTSAVRDVAVDGIMCVDGRDNDACDKIQSVQWTSITIAGIIAGLIGGYIADHFNYKLAFLSLVPIYFIILGIVSKYTVKKLDRVRQPIWKNILSYKELIINKKYLLTCLFLFLFNFNPSFGTPLMFIERDTFHWSGTFMGILGAITSGISIIGSILYFKFGRKVNVKKCLWWSVFIGALTTLCCLYFTAVSAIVYGIIFSALGMFIFLNVMTFMAKSTIPGKEATAFALLCSINNLSGTCSTLTGAYLYPIVGLKWLIIISALTSFLCLPLLKKLEI